ncbi:hypothetical protein [Saccharothrix sp. NRRL B-16348]|uniref:hypothetical protein n=1 Tax=Saccharothrix sp. NRRL B-16348 TaxID=1415542 RepID=UPI0012FB25C8|nr:hypothetical protein [Saccharothrix sp. NRRL B-16348]
MAEPNDLVVKPDAESGGFVNAGTGDNGWMTGISIAESAMDTFNGIKDGNWVQAGLGMVGLAADAAAMAIDPFGTLMSSAASFLMEHVQRAAAEGHAGLAGGQPAGDRVVLGDVGEGRRGTGEDRRGVHVRGAAGHRGVDRFGGGDLPRQLQGAR